MRIAEIDYSKNESHTTGYISGDTVLITNVTSDRDFHKSNASMFFGVPYEQVSKVLRQLTKRVNHGKSYNMGDKVLVDTMGLKNIFLAKELLRLPRGYTAINIAAYLGKCFAKTYKVLTGPYQEWIKTRVSNTRLLIGATGWIRYCFGDPKNNKLDLNAYIAHPPQSLGAILLNKSVLRIYNEVWRYNYQNFKMVAQIHDSNLLFYRDGYEHLIQQAADCMVNETIVEDIFGKKRVMKIPVDISMGGDTWQDSKDH